MNLLTANEKAELDRLHYLDFRKEDEATLLGNENLHDSFISYPGTDLKPKYFDFCPLPNDDKRIFVDVVIRVEMTFPSGYKSVESYKGILSRVTGRVFCLADPAPGEVAFVYEEEHKDHIRQLFIDNKNWGETVIYATLPVEIHY